ncbi:MAG: hypothetical protein Q9190_002184 [Brigantiaea leucoxantha]
MLSRGNSEASARLRRAKSSASLQNRRSLPIEAELPYPQEARVHALAAASRAFLCANDRKALPKASNRTSPAHIKEISGQSLQRKQSIRFAGPAAAPPRQRGITQRSTPNHDNHDYHRNSTHPLLRQENSSMQDEGGFTIALPQHGDYEETQVASQPSSYRRLRQSKSMINPRASSSTFFKNAKFTKNHSPFPGPKSFHSSDNQTSEALTSKLRRSISFLRFNSEQPNYRVAQEEPIQEEAIEMARAEYLRQLEHEKLQGRPSLASSSHLKKSQKPFRKTVRTRSRDTDDDGLASTSLHTAEDYKVKAFGQRARSLSSSLKIKIKRAFGRSPDFERQIPTQQLHASKIHYSENAENWLGQSVDHSPKKPMRDDLGRRTDPYESRMLVVPQRRASLVESVSSASSEDVFGTGKSRVTSWTNSTAASSLATRPVSQKKRLSIIQENTNTPSLLSPAPLSRVQDYGHNISQKSNQTSLGDHSDGLSKHQTGLAPSMHLLSDDAINDRLECGRHSNYYDYNRQKSENPPPELKPGHTRSDQRRYFPARNDKELCWPTSPSSTEDQGVSYILSQPIVNTESLQEAKKNLLKKSNSSIQAAVYPNGIKGNAVEYPLREASSTSFPSLTNFENTSPYHRRMQHNTGWPSETGTNVVSNLNSLPKATRTDSTAFRKAHSRSLTGSESVYSRTSSGDTPRPATSYMSPSNLKIDVGSGGATPRPPSPEESIVSNATFDLSRVAAAIGHRREHAQIDTDDVCLGQTPRSASFAARKFTQSRPGSNSKYPLKHGSLQAMVDRFPLMEIKPRQNGSDVQQRTPSTPTTPLAKIGGRENAGSNFKPLCTPPKKLTAEPTNPSPISQCIFGSAAEGLIRQQRHRTTRNDLSPNAKFHRADGAIDPGPKYQCSPERLARLCRIQNSTAKQSPSPRKKMNAGVPLGDGHLHNGLEKENRSSTEQSVEHQNAGAADDENSAIEYTAQTSREALVIGDRRKAVDIFLDNRKSITENSENRSHYSSFL